MRRSVLIALLLANAGVLFWNLSGDVPPLATAASTRPPGHPAALREIVLGPIAPQSQAPATAAAPAAEASAPAAVAAVSPPPPLAAEPAGMPAAPETSAAPVAASGASDPLCVQTAWMPAQRIEVLANDRALRADRIAGDWVRVRAKSRPLWMVFVGPMAMKDIAPLQADLTAKGVAAQEVFTPWRFALPASAQRGLNLGYYDTEAAAQARRDQVAAAGGAQATVVAIDQIGAQRLRGRLKEAGRVQELIAASDPRAPWQACPAGITPESAPTLSDAAFGDGAGVTTEAVSKRR